MKDLIRKVLYEFVEIYNADDYKPLKPSHPIYTAIESLLETVQNPYQIDYTMLDELDYDVMTKFEFDRSHGGLEISKKTGEITGEIRINILELYYIALGPDQNGERDYLYYMTDVSNWHWEDFRDELRDKITNHLPALENIKIEFNPIFQKKK
jgi:hypothetical protein